MGELTYSRPEEATYVCKGPEARQTCLAQRLNGGNVAKQEEAAETKYVGRAAGGTGESCSLPFRVGGNQRHFKQRTMGRSQTPSCVLVPCWQGCKKADMNPR